MLVFDILYSLPFVSRPLFDVLYLTLSITTIRCPSLLFVLHHHSPFDALHHHSLHSITTLCPPSPIFALHHHFPFHTLNLLPPSPLSIPCHPFNTIILMSFIRCPPSDTLHSTSSTRRLPLDDLHSTTSITTFHSTLYKIPPPSTLSIPHRGGSSSQIGKVALPRYTYNISKIKIAPASASSSSVDSISKRAKQNCDTNFLLQNQSLYSLVRYVYIEI